MKHRPIYGWPLPKEQRETWRFQPDYREKNDGAGYCNTAWGNDNDTHVICALGGIGCNVDHFAILRDRMCENAADREAA